MNSSLFQCQIVELDKEVYCLYRPGSVGLISKQRSHKAAMGDQDEDTIVKKIIIIGDAFAGKTSLFIRFTEDTFYEQGTVWTEMESKELLTQRSDNMEEECEQ